MPGIRHPALGGQRYADLIRNTRGLIGYWRLRDSSGTVARDELGLVNGTYSGSPPLAIGTPIRDGGAVKTNGTNQYVTIVKNLSAYSTLSLSFWMWWDTFANDDKIVAEYGGASYTNNGFVIDPNASNAGRQKFNFGIGTNTGGAGSWHDDFNRPSAAAWHHYVLTFDRATPVHTAFVDGVTPANYTTLQHDVRTYGNFSNSTLRLMSRNGTNLFGAGRLSEWAMFGGVLLTARDAATQYNVGVGR